MIVDRRIVDSGLTANQQDLDSLHTWCKNHNLSINLNKTSYVIFGQKRLINKVAKKEIQIKVIDMPIKQAEAFKYLGFTIDSTLSLNTHINTVIRTVNTKLNTLMQTRTLVGEKTALLLYKTLILPILEYNSCCFTLLVQHQKDQLERLQNRGLKIVFKANPRESTDNLHL